MIGTRTAQKIKNLEVPQGAPSLKYQHLKSDLSGYTEENSLFVYSTDRFLEIIDGIELSDISKVKALHFCSLIYQKQYFSDYGTNKETGSRLNSRILQKKYGKTEFSRIRDILENKELIEVDHNFKKRAFSMGFRINLDSPVRGYLVRATPKLVSKLRPSEVNPDHNPDIEKPTNGRPLPAWITPQYHSRRDYLLEVQRNLVIKPDWDTILQKVPETKHERIRACVLAHQRENFFASSAESGRWFHLVTGFNKELRRKVLINGDCTTEIDIKSAQPSIMASFYPAHTPEKEKYLGVILSGKFYEYVGTLVGKAIDTTNREEFKQEVLKQVFYDQHGDSIKGYYILTAFKKEFPELGTILEKFKRDRAKDKLAMHMQKMESSIVIEGVIDRAIDAGIPALPVHDSVMCRAEDLTIISGFLNESFKAAAGFIPQLRETESE